MNEKLKKKIIFVIIDTGYWILTLSMLVLLISLAAAFLTWNHGVLTAGLGIKWLILRFIFVVSLLFALIAGWANGYRN